MFLILISKWGSERTSGQRFSGNDSGNYMNVTHCSCRKFCRRKPLLGFSPKGFSPRAKNLVIEGNTHAIRVSNVILVALLIKITTAHHLIMWALSLGFMTIPLIFLFYVLRRQIPQAEAAHSLLEITSSSSRCSVGAFGDDRRLSYFRPFVPDSHPEEARRHILCTGMLHC